MTEEFFMQKGFVDNFVIQDEQPGAQQKIL